MGSRTVSTQFELDDLSEHVDYEAEFGHLLCTPTFLTTERLWPARFDARYSRAEKAGQRSLDQDLMDGQLRLL